MIALDQAGNRQLSLITTQNGCDIIVNFSDYNTSTGAYVRGVPTLTTVSSATTTVICAAPAAGNIRDVDFVNIKNTFAGNHTITIQITATSGGPFVIKKIILSIDEAAEYTHGTGWRVIDANGNLKVSNPITGLGLHSLWIPAGGAITRTTSGATYRQGEYATNKTQYSGYEFSAGAVNYIQFFLGAPKSWDKSTITAKFVWSAVAADVNDVVWQIAGVAVGDTDAVDPARGTFITVTDGAGNTTPGQIRVTGTTSAITIAGSPATDDMIIIEVLRDPAHGSDTSTNVALLLGIWLNFNYNAINDT